MSESSKLEEVNLTAFAFGGDCIGRLNDGRAVFVPYGVPGELVLVKLVEEKPRFARATLVEIIKPDQTRIPPRCKHFGVCGGCHYQHLPIEKQSQAKQAILKDHLWRIGELDTINVGNIISSAEQWNYRNSIQYHLSNTGKIGFQERNSNTLVEIEECYLPMPAIDQLWRQFDFGVNSGIERIELRSGIEGEVMIVLESPGFEIPEFSVDLPLSAVHVNPAGEIVLAGENHLLMEVRQKLFQVSAQSFFQVNIPQAGAMVSFLLNQIPFKPGATVLDIYCGVGLFSRFIAPSVERCVGIELSETACGDFAVNLDEFDNVDLYIGATEKILPQLDLQVDIAIVDPPRSGMDKHALDALIAKNPELIAYISCDPATLSRDIRRLILAGYQVNCVQPFDLFPQTYHIETIVVLEK